MNGLSTHSVFVSSLVRVGNYSELNPKGCGFNRFSLRVDTKCFKWHKEVIPSLKRGRNVGIGDAPWMDLLIFDNIMYSYFKRTFLINLYNLEWVGHSVQGL